MPKQSFFITANSAFHIVSNTVNCFLKTGYNCSHRQEVSKTSFENGKTCLPKDASRQIPLVQFLLVGSQNWTRGIHFQFGKYKKPYFLYFSLFLRLNRLHHRKKFTGPCFLQFLKNTNNGNSIFTPHKLARKLIIRNTYIIIIIFLTPIVAMVIYHHQPILFIPFISKLKHIRPISVTVISDSRIQQISGRIS